MSHMGQITPALYRLLLKKAKLFEEKDYRFVVIGTDFGIRVYNRLKMWYFMFDFKIIP